MATVFAVLVLGGVVTVTIAFVREKVAEPKHGVPSPSPRQRLASSTAIVFAVLWFLAGAGAYEGMDAPGLGALTAFVVALGSLAWWAYERAEARRQNTTESRPGQHHWTR